MKNTKPASEYRKSLEKSPVSNCTNIWQALPTLHNQSKSQQWQGQCIVVSQFLIHKKTLNMSLLHLLKLTTGLLLLSHQPILSWSTALIKILLLNIKIIKNGCGLLKDKPSLVNNIGVVLVFLVFYVEKITRTMPYF